MHKQKKHHRVTHNKISPNNAELFYGFWGSCHNSYNDATPHAGYDIMCEWRDKVGHDNFFCLTSNVDGHWRRFFDPNYIEEFNGSIGYWQCANPHCLSRQITNDPTCNHGRWKIPSGYRFHVDPVTLLAPNGLPTHMGDIVGSQQPHDQKSFASNHPLCIYCGNKARPNVKMFNDSTTYLEPLQPSHSEWLMSMERKIVNEKVSHNKHQSRFVIIEIGAGENVRTMRHIAMKVANEMALGDAKCHVTLIRVNPEFPLPGTGLCGEVDFIPLMEGALKACLAIDTIIKVKRKKILVVTVDK